MKRILSVLFIAALLITCMVTTAFASDRTTISVSNEVAKTGDEVTVEFNLTGNTGFKAYGMVFTYDVDALELVSVAKGDLSNDGLFTKSNNVDGQIKVGYSHTEAVSKDGVLFTATFKVLAGEGEYAVGLELDKIGLSSTDVMTATVVNGSVTVPHICAPVAQNGTPATCTVDGVKDHSKCACGKLFIDGAEVTAEDLVIPATGHDWEWVVDEPATEDETGLKHEECSVCKEKRNENTVIPVLTHSCTNCVKVPEVPATCEKDGVKEHYKCEKCGTLYDAEGKEVTAEDLVIKAIGHTYTSVVTKPTCTKDGYTTHTCACGDSYVDTTVKATGHDWKWVVDKAATEDETGVKHEECAVCNEKRNENTVIPALNHDCKDRVKVSEVPATCEKDGVKEHYKCEKYGTLYDAEGKEVTADDLVIKATGHTEKLTGKAEADCEADGYTGDKVCADCGEVLEKGKVIPAIGHDYDKDGHCKNCGYIDPETGDSHNLFVWILAMAACAGAAYVTLRKRNNA